MVRNPFVDKTSLITGPVRDHRFPVLDADSADDASTPEVDNAPQEENFIRTQLGGVSDRAVMESAIARIKQDAEIEIREAHEKGYAKGLEDGNKTAKDEMGPIVQQLRQSFAEIEKYRKEIYSAAETSAVRLAMAISESVIHNEIASHQDVVRHVVSAALKKVVDHERIRIRVNPGDLELLNNSLFEFSGLVENIESVRFEPDDGIAVGGCIVETQFGFVDARIDSQLAEIRSQLNRELEKNRFNR